MSTELKKLKANKYTPANNQAEPNCPCEECSEKRAIAERNEYPEPVVER